MKEYFRASFIIFLFFAPCRQTDAQTKKDSSLSLFNYNRGTPFDWKDSLLQKQDHLSCYRISFNSPLGGRATGVLIVPDGKIPFAGVILQHGMPSSAIEYLPRAIYIAKHGAVVIALDAPFARRTGDALSFTEQDSIEQIQMIVDLQRATDILISRKDVDAKRLAYVGRSYGGMIGILFAAVEKRINNFILSVADGGLVTHFTDSSSNGDAFRALPKTQREKWINSMLPLEPIHYTSFIHGKNFLLQSGLHDHAVPLNNARKLQMLLPKPKKIIWYNTEHDLNAQAYIDQLNWLHLNISTTVTTKADETAPVTLQH